MRNEMAKMDEQQPDRRRVRLLASELRSGAISVFDVLRAIRKAGGCTLAEAIKYLEAEAL